MAPYDVVGNIVLAKFARDATRKEKKQFAHAFLEAHPHVTTVLEKTGRIKGRLRTPETKWIAGEKTKEALYKENGCVFRFHVDTCYFSPRLADERKQLAGIVKKGERVLVLFGGVAPFAIVIAKAGKAREVVSVELNKSAQRYARENVKRNKVNVHVVQGDVKKALIALGSFDRIIMTRPNLQETFLRFALRAARKHTVIHYYGFCLETELKSMKEQLLVEARHAHRTLRIVRTKKAGDIGTRKYRYRIDLKVC